MGQPSTITRLPEDILEKFHELLRDPRVTQLDATAKINEILRQEGLEPVSKSAINRYDLEIRKVGERLQQSREIAQVLIGKLGAAPQGQTGLLVNEIARKICFDLSLKLDDVVLDEETMPGVMKMVKDLALAVQRLEASSTINVKRDAEIRKKALADAAEQAGQVAKRSGMSAATVQQIKTEILGIPQE